MSKSIEGYITVYLSLTLGILLTFIFMVIEGVRIQTTRLETECVTDMALNSIFAEYNRQLLEQYELFYIDSSYGQGNTTFETVENHILYYMNQNFSRNFIMDSLFTTDITRLHADNVTLLQASLPTDDNGKVLLYQIVQHMKMRTGITLAENLSDQVAEIKRLENQDITSERLAVDQKIDTLLAEEQSQLPEGEELNFHNPADVVNQTRGSGILSMALPNGKTISGKSVELSQYVSKRNRMIGQGLPNDKTCSGNIVDLELFQSYLFQVCGFYTGELSKSNLKYQVEYIIAGENSDEENLKNMLNRILMIREVANMAYLFSDSEKNSQVDAIAALIAASLKNPALQQSIKTSILYAWGYAESVKDIRILLDGNRVPAQKTKNTWNTPLTNLPTFLSHLDEYNKMQSGMDYQDYIKTFLWMVPTEEKLFRFMDIIEMDIRNTNGNQYFKMDGCIDWLCADINVSSNYGYGYEIIREYSYE